MDDEDHWREAARIAFEGDEFEVVALASNGPDAALLAARHKPDIVIVDEHMRAMSGAHTATVMRRLLPEVTVVGFCDDPGTSPDWADVVVNKPEIARAVTELSGGAVSGEARDTSSRQDRPS